MFIEVRCNTPRWRPALQRGSCHGQCTALGEECVAAGR